jgi:predicted unusual protein kinase regulating ubiquinone biosynthesis (AarF/ABC1/UbiB family)
MLVQELDFTQEARFQRLFRFYAKKDKLDWLTAPKVYIQYCTQDVIVSEFVEGVWCNEILQAHELGDPQALGKLREMGITPKKVGGRLMQYSFWSRFEALFFHSDPHPGNILVQRDCKIVFVDFGSCGTTSRKSRMAQLMMIERMSYNDVSGTVDAAIATLEPLPYIDVYELKKDVESHFWDWLFAFRDKKAEWWERTTAGIWFALLDITRRRQIPVGLETLRLARSLLLIDTLCFELDPQMVSPDEFQRYMRKAARRGARRVIKRAQRTPISSVFDTVIWQTDDMVTRGRFMAWQAERFIDTVPNEFALGISKGMYIFSIVLKLGTLVGAVAAFIALYKRFYHKDDNITVTEIIELFLNPFVLIFFTIPVFVSARRIWHRLMDLDVPKSRGRD